MKNLYIFFTVITLITLSSCDSKNDTTPVQPTSSLKATINGVEVIFDTFKVVKNPGVDDAGNPYTDLVVTVTKSTDATKKVTFNLAYLETGTEACYYFSYLDGDIDHDTEIADSFAINISGNTATNLKGTFNGTLTNSDNTSSVVIPNGTFDITY